MTALRIVLPIDAQADITSPHLIPGDRIPVAFNYALWSRAREYRLAEVRSIWGSKDPPHRETVTLAVSSDARSIPAWLPPVEV